MSIKTYTLPLLLLLCMALPATGKSYYNTSHNNFGGLYPNPGMRMMGRYKAIEGNQLIDANSTMATAVCTDTMLVTSIAYRYQLRLANLNNIAGKSPSVKDPMTGGKTKLTSTKWGLVFNRTDEEYWAVELSCDNSNLQDDLTDMRPMTVTLVHCTGGTTNQIASAQLSSGVALEDGMNNVCVDVDERSVRVSVGKDELQQVIETAVQRPTGEVAMGYLAGPGARVAIERAVLTIRDDEASTTVTTSSDWTRENLDERFAASTDPLEGYWKYLDREMEDQWLRLGGRYTLAVVRSGEDTYDLIYVDGAQVKKSMWQTGMTKGRLTKTIFTDHYDGVWIDATMQPIDRDVYATITDGVILALDFPVYKSQVRFSKVLNNH